MSCVGLGLLGLLAYLGTGIVWPVFPVAKEDPASQQAVNRSLFNKLNGETTVGGYRVRLLGIGSLDGMPSLMDYKPTLDNQSFQMNQFGNVAANQFGNSSSFSNQSGTGGAVGGFGNATAGGGGAVGANAGGATFSNVGIQPNCGIAFKIEPVSRQAKKNGVIVELEQKVKVTDVDGEVSESEDNGPLRITYPQFEKNTGTSFAAYLYRNRGAEGAIQKVEGVLKLTSGRLVEAEFSGTNPQTKRIVGDEFRLNGVQVLPQGLQIQVTFPETVAMKRAQNFFEKFEALRTASDAYDLRIEDRYGNVFLPNGKSSSGGGGASASSQGFSINGRTQMQSNSSESMSLSTITFVFRTLPPDADIAKIVATVRETEGKPTLVPFIIDVK